jgi:hypothetical protein
MGSFAAIHVRGQETEQLADVIEKWLRPAGFGTRVRTDSATWPEHRIFGPAKTAVLGRLTESWHVLHVGGFSLANDGLSASGLRRLGGLVGDRIVFFAAQTTSSAYELVVLDGATVVRHLASSDHELLDDVGEHLEGEPSGGAFRYPEDEHGEWSSTPMDEAKDMCSAMQLPLWERFGTPPFAVWTRRGWLARLLAG